MAMSFAANKLSKSSPQLISALILVDGISALFIGAIYFFLIHMTDYFSDDATVGVMMRNQADFVMRLAFGYLIVSVISLLFVRKRKLFGTIMLAGLATFHTVGIALLTVVNGRYVLVDFFTPILIASLIFNLALLFIIFRGSPSTVKTG